MASVRTDAARYPPRRNIYMLFAADMAPDVHLVSLHPATADHPSEHQLKPPPRVCSNAPSGFLLPCVTLVGPESAA